MSSTPSSPIESTWSFIREISGETTSVRPPSSRAGIWYVTDLPAPVGITPRQSRPAITAWMISSCPARKLEYPNVSFNTASARAPASAARDALARAAASRNSSTVRGVKSAGASR